MPLLLSKVEHASSKRDHLPRLLTAVGRVFAKESLLVPNDQEHSA
jgi:hypothetical protein